MNEITTLSKGMEKFIKSLHLNKFRNEYNQYVVEGVKACSEMLHSNITPKCIVINESFNDFIIDIFLKKNFTIYRTFDDVFDKISGTMNPQGILACVSIPEVNINEDLNFIALDGISDPGNVGTIIRTAEWFGFKQIILGSNSCDVYNAKTVRATMGSIFRMNCFQTQNLSGFIEENFPKHELYGASLDAKMEIEKCQPKNLFGLLIGSESHGLSKDILKNIDNQFIIKGLGSAESLNAAVATGIILYHFSKFI